MIALYAIAAKGIEQRHLFLLYQSTTFGTTDYGLGLATPSYSSLLNFNRVQNDVTGDIQIEAMKYLLELPPKETKHKLEPVKTHLTVMQNPKSPFHDAIKEGNRCRLARSKS